MTNRHALSTERRDVPIAHSASAYGPPDETVRRARPAHEPTDDLTQGVNREDVRRLRVGHVDRGENARVQDEAMVDGADDVQARNIA